MRHIVVIYLLVIVKSIYCQDVRIIFNQKDSIKTAHLPDSIIIKKEKTEKKLRYFQNKMISEGYLLFSYDSILKKGATINCFVTINEKFNKAILKMSQEVKSEIIKKLK